MTSDAARAGAASEAASAAAASVVAWPYSSGATEDGSLASIAGLQAGSGKVSARERAMISAVAMSCCWLGWCLGLLRIMSVAFMSSSSASEVLHQDSQVSLYPFYSFAESSYAAFAATASDSAKADAATSAA